MLDGSSKKVKVGPFLHGHGQECYVKKLTQCTKKDMEICKTSSLLIHPVVWP